MKEPSWLSGKVEGNMDDVNWVRVLTDASDSVILLDCNKGVEHIGTERSCDDWSTDGVCILGDGDPGSWLSILIKEEGVGD